MYVAIYRKHSTRSMLHSTQTVAIAMSVRSTNVYEEQALGVYKHVADEDEEPELHGERRAVFR